MLSDGTGNSSASLWKTNVRRFYDALDLADPKKPEIPRQFVFYDDGVGSTGFRPFAALAGAFGFGLARNIRELYAFLCRTYEPGDQIYGLGFSRGAFTIRAVAGIISRQGLLPYDGSEESLTRRVAALYRRDRRKRYEDSWSIAGWFWWLRNRLAKAFRPGRPGESDAAQPAGKEVRIRFIGVWDTVDAYGSPFEELTHFIDRYIFPFTFKDADLSKKVDCARQALSLDEERQTFHPRLWNEADEEDPERIRQVWFAGVHADVGGGYPDGSLSYVPLLWMIEAAKKAGLRFSPAILAEQRALADANGPIHDPRRSVGGYYRYRPRDVRALSKQDRGDRPIPGRPLVRIDRPRIHGSVFRRMKDGHDGYAPLGLPACFEVEGEVPTPPGEEPPIAGQQDLAPEFEARKRHAWNLVSLRRAAYYVALFGSLGLVLAPLLLEAGGCSSFNCFLAQPILLLGALLPDFASPSIAALSSNPNYALTCLFLIGAGVWMGSLLKTRIADEMRRVCYGLLPRLRPNAVKEPHGGAAPAAAVPGWLGRIVGRLRESARLQAFSRFMSWKVMPVVTSLGALLLVLVVMNAFLLDILEARGDVCRDANASHIPVNGVAIRHIDTREPCQPLAVLLDGGATYRIRVTLLGGDDAGAGRAWRDGSLAASPRGLEALSLSDRFLMGVASPLRRHLGEPWFRLMARVGEKGIEHYGPDWRLLPEASAAATYEAELTPWQTGPLFLYVNDAMPVFFWRGFYSNNKGAAMVQVEELHRRTTPR
nr:DUF2235 domain-containing protein [Roseococcus sp. MDT2-1-1]